MGNLKAYVVDAPVMAAGKNYASTLRPFCCSFFHLKEECHWWPHCVKRVGLVGRRLKLGVAAEKEFLSEI